MSVSDATPAATVACPRCSGCGDDCGDCQNQVVLVKRSGCRICGGRGRVACAFDHPHPDHPCATAAEAPGAPCNGCEKPTPLDGSLCPGCWQAVPDNLADQKAMFADMGLSLTKQGESDV